MRKRDVLACVLAGAFLFATTALVAATAAPPRVSEACSCDLCVGDF